MEIHALSGFRGLGAVDPCSDRAMMTQTIITMAASAVMAYGKGSESKSTAAVGGALTGATQQWIQRCAAQGAAASELQAAAAQIELQKMQLTLQVQQEAARLEAERAESAGRNQLIMLGLGGAAFLGVALILRRRD